LCPGATTGEQIAEVQGRLQRAVASNALLQRAGAGAGEHDFESHSLVEAVELQLAGLRQHPPVTVDVLPGTRKPS
jgi:hypothetical protein